MTGRHRRSAPRDPSAGSRRSPGHRPARGRSRSDDPVDSLDSIEAIDGPEADPADPATLTGSDRPEVVAKGELTRRAILLSAIDRFGQDGFRSTSVAKIARDAGVGATITWAYWPNKEALFLAALDEDAAAVIEEGTACVFDAVDTDVWRTELVVTLLEAVDRHPLARRVLSGLEPHVTGRVLEIPALTELRKAVAERLRADQAAGVVRPDIDPVAVGSGLVVIVISLLTSILQFGRDAIDLFGLDVAAVFAAAVEAAPSTGELHPERRGRGDPGG